MHLNKAHSCRSCGSESNYIKHVEDGVARFLVCGECIDTAPKPRDFYCSCCESVTKVTSVSRMDEDALVAIKEYSLSLEQGQKKKVADAFIKEFDQKWKGKREKYSPFPGFGQIVKKMLFLFIGAFLLGSLLDSYFEVAFTIVGVIYLLKWPTFTFTTRLIQTAVMLGIVIGTSYYKKDVIELAAKQNLAVEKALVEIEKCIKAGESEESCRAKNDTVMIRIKGFPLPQDKKFTK